MFFNQISMRSSQKTSLSKKLLAGGLFLAALTCLPSCSRPVAASQSMAYAAARMPAQAPIMTQMMPQMMVQATGSSLEQVRDFGSNPGQLNMWRYTPSHLPEGAPLVVALHGCTQNAREYAQGSGWMELAERWNFALLLPEQNKANNGYNCFNWGGDPNGNQRDMDRCDTERGCGENLSIKQMVDRMLSEYRLNPRRVYITGLSAGAAFTNVMLATYPDVFAGGAVIAGLPYLCNQNAQGKLESNQAFMCMSMGRSLSPTNWAALVKERSGFQAPPGFQWPSVQVWHGTKDFTVKPTNQAEIVKQWAAVHGLSPEPSQQDEVQGYPHKVYASADGQVRVESFEITGMGHAVPVDPDGSGGFACGQPGQFMADTQICAAYVMGQRWGLNPAQ